MTDKKTEISQASSTSKPAVNEPVSGTSAAKPGKPGAAAHTAAPGVRKRRSVLLPLFIVVLIIAVALAAAVWYQQQRFEQTSQQLISQAQNSSNAASQALDQAKQALALTQQQASQISSLEGALQQFQGQVDGLDQAFQTLTDSGSDLVLVNDVDHLVTIAQQQLQLGGNVANAIISLETAQAQLARANRPGLASLQQTLNGDLERLRASSTVDIAALSAQLEELSGLVSQASLLVPDDAAPEPVPAPEQATPAGSEGSTSEPVDPNASWWEQSWHTTKSWSQNAWQSVSQDLGQFITVRRIDDSAALLMSPDQAARFRETLRLRIMTAQLALMMKQPQVWQTETAALVQAIESRFDNRSAQVRQALKIARQMADTTIQTSLPTVDNTLQALEALRSERQKESADQQDEADTETASADSQHDEADANTSNDQNLSEPASGAEPVSETNGTQE